jgi:MinD-like ATPase involved in chromosome partitioning or flagellar assembly
VNVVLALSEPRAQSLAADLRREGVTVIAIVAPGALDHTARRLGQGVGDDPVAELLGVADALVLDGDRRTLTRPAVDLADRFGVRILPLGRGVALARLCASYGLREPLPADADAEEVVAALAATPALPAAASAIHPVIAVWGPAGAPGRTTVAIEVAAELARGHRRVALVDADAHAPSVAVALGLPVDGPGLAAACRQHDQGGVDAAELERVAIAVDVPDGEVDVLVGINRVARWPELAAPRVTGVLAACRTWADATVVDIAAPLERDEEIVSDVIDGPRRNQAALAVLAGADAVVAVCAADPVGVSRFVAAYDQLHESVGAAPIVVVANRVRSGVIGVDARGQVRSTLERYLGIRDLAFLPDDRRAADRALLAGRRDIAPFGPRPGRATRCRCAPRAVGRPSRTPPGGGGRGRRLVRCRPSAIWSRPMASTTPPISSGFIASPETGSCSPTWHSPTS